jgi:hypothetical protein
MKTRYPFPARAACALLLGLWLSAVSADTYQIEMIVFERPGGGQSEFWPQLEAGPGQANDATAEPDWPPLSSLAAGDRKLGPVAYSLRQRGMNVLEHLVWREVPAGLGSDRWYRVEAGRLQGLVRVRRGRFLHLETDLLLRDAVGPESYRVRLQRRMRSDELHYVDHPKLGILIEADRYAPAPEVTPAVDSGEPAPAEPIGSAQGN